MPPKEVRAYTVRPPILPLRPRTTAPYSGNPYAQLNTTSETFPGPQADIERPVNNNVPETPSKVAAQGLEQMVLKSPDEAPVRGRAIRSLRREFFIRNPGAFDGTDPKHPEMTYPRRRVRGDVGRFPTRNTRAVTSPVQTPAVSQMPPPQTAVLKSPDEALVGGRAIKSVREFFDRNPGAFDVTDPKHPEMTYPRPRDRGDVGQVPTRNTRAVTTPVQTPAASQMPPPQTPTSRMLPPQTPASRMPPPHTPASRIKVPQSPAARLLRSTGPSPTLIVRSTGTHDDGVNATPGVVRVLFPKQGNNLVSTPAPNPNTSEHQLVRPQTGHNPLGQSRLRSVSFTSALEEDTEMASPSVATAERPNGEAHVTTPQNQTGDTTVITPEFQTGGSPPIPHTPRTPHTWISPSQVTPAIVARMRATPVYRNREERMEMTPSPSKLKPASPDDRKMEDAFWTPNKPGASLNVTGSRKKVAAAQNPTPMEYKSPIVDSAPFGDAMAQGIAPIQNVAPIGNPAPVQDAMSPGTTTVRTVISTEITTTIRKTPSPLQSPTPARRPTDNRSRIAAKPHKRADAPRREVASTKQRKGNGGAEQNANRRRTAEHVIPGGINRRQELRTSPRYSLRDSTRGITPGTYSLTPVRNRSFKAESSSKKK